MQLPPVIHKESIDPVETRDYVPATIETILRFGPRSKWSAGAIVTGCSQRSQAVATRCALLIPRRGRQTHKLALHPLLPVEVVKSMLRAI